MNETNRENQEFSSLREGILNCRLCEDKFGFEPQPIVIGDVNAKIMQISQAPSQNVHKTLKPFNDASGKKLIFDWYQISTEIFYNPSNFYITAMAHCYPGKSQNGGDRLPPKICSRQWLQEEVKLVDNRLYVLIGGKATHFFFPKHNFTSLIFSDNLLYGKPVYVLPHPSPLNARWFKENPEFLLSRIQKIRKSVHDVLNLD